MKKIFKFNLLIFINVILNACAPTPAEFLMGTGVAIAVKTEEQKIIQNNSKDKINELKITRELINKNKISFSDLNITSLENNITIDGNLNNISDYLEVLNTIWLQTEIKSVQSKVFIYNDNRDSSISDQLLLRLSEDPIINERNYSIVAINNDIYLIGRPFSSIEESNAIKHAASIGINYNIHTNFYYNKNQLN